MLHLPDDQCVCFLCMEFISVFLNNTIEQFQIARSDSCKVSIQFETTSECFLGTVENQLSEHS